jgi:hypothetical protein
MLLPRHADPDTVGRTPVETLRIADLVTTASGVARPIKWVGRRSYTGRFVVGRTKILPICIKAGALDDGAPRRNIWVSPNHALYFAGMLIEARDLINGSSIAQPVTAELVEYFHVELDSHDLLVAEGIATESYIDEDNRGMFDNARDYYERYPDKAARTAQYCAPRLSEGSAVEQARASIADRAGATAAASNAVGA